VIIAEGCADLVEIPWSWYAVSLRSDDPRAMELLLTACQLLQEQAARLGDEAMRHPFLMNVRYHWELLAEREKVEVLLP
jgi:hypothetical protein